MTACGNSSLNAFSFNAATFRVQFPAFADLATYPDGVLQGYFDSAGCFVANKNYGWLNGCCNLYALNLMTAHLAALNSQIVAGNTPGIETSATIDKVSVTMMEPPVKDGWQFWLSQTPYGQQLIALLTAKAVGGLYTPGGLGRAGFRDTIGNFGNGLGFPYGRY